MLCAILRSELAVQMSILIVRAFIKLRELVANHRELAARVESLETGQRDHASIIGELAAELDDLRRTEDLPRRPIGFQP
jgi:hypothetical protein